MFMHVFKRVLIDQLAKSMMMSIIVVVDIDLLMKIYSTISQGSSS